MEELVRIFGEEWVNVQQCSESQKASERKWLRFFQVSGIGIHGAYKVGTLHQRALRSVFGDDKKLS